MFSTDGYSLADIAAATKDNDGLGSGNGLIWLLLIFSMFSGGVGFGNRAAVDGALTRGELSQDMNFQSIENAVRGVQNGLCDGFYAQNTTMLQGFAGIGTELCNGFNNVNNNITQARFDAQQCCCETNRNIDSVKYENAKNTCDIITAGNANTQRIIDHLTQNEIQTLRDSLQSANFQLSQQAQSANLISTLQPAPIPAYITGSPYQSQAYYNACC